MKSGGAGADAGAVVGTVAAGAACPLCYETFQSSPRALTPRRLTSCDHVLCTGCLDAEIQDGEITCPECCAVTRCADAEALGAMALPSSGGGAEAAAAREPGGTWRVSTRDARRDGRAAPLSGRSVGNASAAAAHVRVS